MGVLARTIVYRQPPAGSAPGVTTACPKDDADRRVTVSHRVVGNRLDLLTSCVCEFEPSAHGKGPSTAIYYALDSAAVVFGAREPLGGGGLMGTVHKAHVPASRPADEGAEPVTVRGATIRIEQLNRPWPCSTCGMPIPRGATVRITITPGAASNRVDHDQNCSPARTAGERSQG